MFVPLNHVRLRLTIGYSREINMKIPAANKSYTGVGLLIAVILAFPAGAGTLTGSVKDADGKAINGVLIRVTDESSGVSESVYTNVDGRYTLVTGLEGTLKLRARSPYFKDAKATVELGGNTQSEENLIMLAMTDDEEISDSLHAA